MITLITLCSNTLFSKRIKIYHQQRNVSKLTAHVLEFRTPFHEGVLQERGIFGNENTRLNVNNINIKIN